MIIDILSSKTKKTSNIFSCKSSIYLINRRIDLITSEALIKYIIESCQLNSKNELIISNYNVHAFNWSIQSSDFYAFQQDADISVCDGMGIIKILQLFGTNIPKKYKVSLTTFVPELLKKCPFEGLSVFLLGSTSSNVKQAIKNQLCKYPKLRLDGYHGFFDPDDTSENQFVIDKINTFKPDILIVGMGMPKQELWIYKNGTKLDTKIIIPCGAVIDRLSGLVPTAPKWISDAGLEWLLRLIREPKRLAARYLIGNTLFLFQVLWAYYFNLNSKDFVRIVEKHHTPDVETQNNGKVFSTEILRKT